MIGFMGRLSWRFELGVGRGMYVQAEQPALAGAAQLQASDYPSCWYLAFVLEHD
jgi:hypothetical protein